MDHRSAAGTLKLATTNGHALDSRITFIEDGHVYVIDGDTVAASSVTGIIEALNPDKFDPDAIIAKMKAGKNWPNPKYSDVMADPIGGGSTLCPWPDNAIKAKWEADGAQASSLGTDLHGKLELFFNDAEVKFDALGTNRTEFQYAVDWWQSFMVPKGWEPWRTEAVIFRKQKGVGIAGSVDFIARNKHSGKFWIVDWKRCKMDGFDDAWGKVFRFPLGAVPLTKRNKWCLQVNIYRDILESEYGMEIEGMCMVVCHQQNSKAEMIEFPKVAWGKTALCAFFAAYEAPGDPLDTDVSME